MRTWAMRIIGLLNILFAVLALLFESVTLWIGWGRWPGKVTPTPMAWAIFALLLAISVYLVVHPARYGIRLIKKDESALLPCAVLFAVQMLAFLFCVWIGLSLPRSMEGFVSGFWVFAILPIQYSVLFGYAAVGLVVTLTLLHSRRAAIRNATKNSVTSDTLAGQ